MLTILQVINNIFEQKEGRAYWAALFLFYSLGLGFQRGHPAASSLNGHDEGVDSLSKLLV